jgi:hypothetical protein
MQPWRLLTVLAMRSEYMRAALVAQKLAAPEGRAALFVASDSAAAAAEARDVYGSRFAAVFSRPNDGGEREAEGGAMQVGRMLAAPGRRECEGAREGVQMRGDRMEGENQRARQR